MYKYPGSGKRVLDLAVATPLFVAMLPVLAMVALVVGWRLGRPVLFWQERAGANSRLFWMPKFRTMNSRRDVHGRLLPDAQRLTPLGRILRSASIDELPELWCVIRGEMSLIGPRPLLVEYLERYTPQQARRHEVKPGLTGLAQVNGRNAISWEERFRLDVQYVDQISFVNDLKILLKTLGCVVRQTGINAPFCATMQPFVGNSAEIAAPSAEIAA